ncbi:hypothetical protein F441_03298 [Phytophthora nicotianae CJ01A1]|nr:hypothetical protein F443_03307 [Phytophthora nicotianae P1569]ETM00164.1 hypothetical protein L917_03086 [Phytophthora nicotianae]ETO82387.1 hypothetical protein F444_03462 [Phytophthora nicotianae P1976]ETP23602.1 hypothetical protein F441_03298 [Phytophthora nicotianae CJ01A1]
MASDGYWSSLAFDLKAPSHASGLRRWTTCGRKLQLGQAEAKWKISRVRKIPALTPHISAERRLLGKWNTKGTLTCGEGPGRGAGTQAFVKKKDAPNPVLIHKFDAKSPL